MNRIISTLLIFTVVFSMSSVCCAGNRTIGSEILPMSDSVYTEDITSIQAEDLIIKDLGVNCDGALDLRASGLFTEIFLVAGGVAAAIVLFLGTGLLVAAIGPAGTIGLALAFK